MKRLASVLFILGAMASIASAADGRQGAASNTLTDIAVNILPIAFVLLILYFVFRRQLKSPLVKLQQQNIENHIQHMRRMEELTERIAIALEKNNKP